jgi:subtilisin family serine protease
VNTIKIKILIVTSFFPLFSLLAVSPEDSLKYANWQNLDPILDKKMGVSVEKAYNELLKGKESKTVVVAVLDSGVDIDHEDLKDIIWVNEDEIPDNGIDDDNNGYIDDIHGWNFLGNEDGENIIHAPLEVTRLYRIYLEKYGELENDSLQLAEDIDWLKYQNVVSTYDIELENVKQSKAAFQKLSDKYYRFDSIVSELLLKKDYSLVDLKGLKVEKKSLSDSAKKFMIRAKIRGLNNSLIAEYQDYYSNRINYHYNTEFYARPIVGDDEYVWLSAFYGNNDVEGDDPLHGTMVSGVIGGVRNNNIGVNGIADNVKIMSVRTVPDGDEWDKDVASAIKYAIDNGADIINMSFGKGFSPQKQFVDSIVKLVDANNVLLVHAAGNENTNIDEVDNFPNRFSVDLDTLADAWLTIGASTISANKKGLVANFSNYGKQNVDIFAPGHDMFLCSPNNTYEIASGTSFAAPVVSGVAALIKSYYPELTALEIKDIILRSSVIKDVKVKVPGTQGKLKEVVPLSTLSATGGLVNVYQALLLAKEKVEN